MYFAQEEAGRAPDCLERFTVAVLQVCNASYDEELQVRVQSAALEAAPFSEYDRVVTQVVKEVMSIADGQVVLVTAP